MNQLLQLQHIHALSEQMLKVARDGKWQELEALEATERFLVTQLSSLPEEDENGTKSRYQLIQATLDNHLAIAEFTEPAWQDIKILLKSLAESVGTNK